MNAAECRMLLRKTVSLFIVAYSFYHAAECRHGLAMRIMSVRLSVHLSNA